jgi:gas vesicle protein
MVSKMNTKKIFISFLAGSAVGSAIALLYAPKAGKQLRKDISRKTKEFIDDSKKITSDTWDGAKELAGNAFDSANDVLNSNVEKIERKTDKVKDAFKSGYKAYRNERESETNKNSSLIEDLESTHRKRS